MFNINIRYFPTYTSDNIDKAENYIYDKKKYSIIIVGSSMSSKLSLKNNYNLSFIGEGPFTSLEIIRKTGKLPKTIIIESNYLVRPMNRKFTESILAEPMNTLKQFFPALLEKNQPTFKFFNIIFPANNSKTTLLNRDRIWEIKKSEYLQLYPEEKINQTTKDFNETINYFKDKKIKIIFLTIPIDTSLRNTPRFKQEFQMWEKLVRQNNLQWIKSRGHFKTIDGEHLLANDNKLFSNFLDHELIK